MANHFHNLTLSRPHSCTFIQPYWYSCKQERLFGLQVQADDVVHRYELRCHLRPGVPTDEPKHQEHFTLLPTTVCRALSDFAAKQKYTDEADQQAYDSRPEHGRWCGHIFYFKRGDMIWVLGRRNKKVIWRPSLFREDSCTKMYAFLDCLS